MITLKLKSGIRQLFNLKNFEREKALRDAWYSMSGDDKYADRKLKITTDTGETILPKISDIEDVIFEESEYCRPSRVGSVTENQTQRTQSSTVRSDADRVRDFMRRHEDRNLNQFMSELRKRGINLEM